MARFRKKPVVVEALQFDGANHALVLAWATALAGAGTMPIRVHETKRDSLIIDTLEGEHRADPADWIICGVQGEFYPVKPAIFEATYEVVD
jgi:hypothetical protein